MASLPITAKLDYFLLPGGIRPYVGVEGGLYLSRAKVTYNGTSQTDSESHAGVAPKAGLLVGFGQGLALHLAGGYHLTFVDSEIGKTLLLEAGVALQMGDL